MKFFFLILLIIVLIYLSVKPIEGFDSSYNSLDISNAHIALYTIVFVLFIIIAFLVIKIRSN
jgi:TRAP-type mannitol/chloroaromatic compound transport system permease small subunit